MIRHFQADQLLMGQKSGQTRKTTAQAKRAPRDSDWESWVDGLHVALDGVRKPDSHDAFLRSLHQLKACAQALGLIGVQKAAHELEARAHAAIPGSESESDAEKSTACGRPALAAIERAVSRLREIELKAAGERELRGLRPPRARERTLKDLLLRISGVTRSIALEVGLELEVSSRCRADVVLDRETHALLEAALLHAARNAVDHGRARDIRFAAEIEDGEIRIDCADDGVGIDAHRVRELARERSPRFDAEMGALSDESVLQLLFLPGFSLSRGVSQLSGRGYGLDIVREAVETKLGGRVRLESRPREGTRLELRFTLARSRR